MKLHNLPIKFCTKTDWTKPNSALECVENIAAQFKLNLRPLLVNVEFSDVAETSELSKAIEFLRKMFGREQILSNINPNKFPIGFIPEKSLRYFYQIDKKSGGKQISVNRLRIYRLSIFGKSYRSR